jgi:hypothetical protein
VLAAGEGVYLAQTAMHCYLMHKYMQLINVTKCEILLSGLFVGGSNARVWLEGLIMGCGELRGLLHIIS